MQAQGEPASPDPVATTARHIRELRGLIASLDSLLPYLNLAISAAGLLAAGESSQSDVVCLSNCVEVGASLGSLVPYLETGYQSSRAASNIGKA